MSSGNHPSNNFPAFPFIASQVMFIALKVTNRWLGCAQMQLKEYSTPTLKMQSISEIPNHLSFITLFYYFPNIQCS